MRSFSIFFILSLLFPFRFEHQWLYFSTISVLDISLTIIFFIIIIFTAYKRKLFIGDKFVFLILTLPFFFTVISLAWSVNVSDTFKSIVVYGTSLFTFIITVTIYRNFSKNTISLIILCLPVVLIFTAILSYIPGSPLSPTITMPSPTLITDGFLLSYQARFSHPFLGLSNNFATILSILLPLVISIRYLEGWRRLTWWVSITTLAAILATGSRGVLLAVVIVLTVPFFGRLISTLRIPRLLLTGIFFAFLLVTVFILVNPVSQRHLGDRLHIVNIESRIHAFSTVPSVLNDYPQGIGAGVSLSQVSNSVQKSVHNAYLQNFLWFGFVGGFILSLSILCLPFAFLLIPVKTLQARMVRQGSFLSIATLLLVNMTQASWEGSLLRIWIYFVVALSIILIKQSDNDYRA
jgi:hypothetical protein